MRNSHRVFAALLGMIGTLSAPAFADPPLPVPAPSAMPPAATMLPPRAPAFPPRFSSGQQKAAQAAAQRFALRRQAQAAEQEAGRLARARQFDQAQRAYEHAASLYHQQARLARRSAQDMAHAGQMSLAARAHAEALAADNRYLACLADEVSAIKKSSLAEKLPPKALPPPNPKNPARVLTQAPQPAPVPRPIQAKVLPKHTSIKPASPRIAAVPPPAPKPRLKIVKMKPAPRLLHAARTRKALPPALKALRQATVRPLKFAPGFIAAQQHGRLQEMLRLRRAQLQEANPGDAAPSTPAPSPSP